MSTFFLKTRQAKRQLIRLHVCFYCMTLVFFVAAFEVLKSVQQWGHHEDLDSARAFQHMWAASSH